MRFRICQGGVALGLGLAALIFSPAAPAAEDLTGCGEADSLATAGDPSAAIDAYNRCLENGGLADEALAWALTRRGALRADIGDHEHAIDDYEAALEVAPRHAEAYAMRAASWRHLGDSERAEEDARSALAMEWLATQLSDAEQGGGLEMLGTLEQMTEKQGVPMDWTTTSVLDN